MKKTISTLLFIVVSLLLSSSFLLGQEPPVLQWIYNSSTLQNEYCSTNHDIIKSPDNGVLVVGDALPDSLNCWTDDFGNYDFRAMKLDSFGSVEWALKYGESGVYETLRKAIYFPYDSTYILAGYSHEQVENLMGSARQFLYLHIAKINLAGDTIWTKAIPNMVDNIDRLFIVNSNPGEFMIRVGSFEGEVSFSEYKARLINFDSNGNILMDINQGENLPYIPYFLSKSIDDKYLISGISQELWQPHFNVLQVEKMDVNGNIQWSHFYEDIGLPYILHHTSTGKILTLGNSGGEFYDEYKIGIISYSGQLDTLFTFGYTPSDQIRSLTSFGNRYFGVGASNSDLLCGDCEDYQGCIFEFDTQGEVLWNFSFKEHINELRINKMIIESPGVYYFIGTILGRPFPGFTGRLIAPSLLPQIEIYGEDQACSFTSLNYTTNISAQVHPDWNISFFNEDEEEVWSTNYLDTDEVLTYGTEAGKLEICITIYDQITECKDVIIGEEKSTESEVVLCSGECFVSPSGEEYCEEGIYPILYNTSLGCDSTVILTLSYLEEQSPTESEIVLCSGECFVSPSGEEYCEEGIYPISYINSFGCDSTVILTLSYLEEQSPTESEIVLCSGECFVSPSGEEYCEEGIYPVSYINSSGCDSTVILTINQSAELSISDSLIIGDTGIGNGTIELNFTGGSSPFSYMWNTGDTTSSINQVPTGYYHITVVDSNGCTEEYDFYVPIINKNSTLVSEENLSIYPNPIRDQNNFIINTHKQLKLFKVEIYNTSGILSYEQDAKETLRGIYSFSAPRDSGIYFIKIIDSTSRVIVKKIIVL